MERIEVDRVTRELSAIIKNSSYNTGAIAKNYGEILTSLTKQIPKSLVHEKYANDPFSPDEEYWLCPRCDADLTDENYDGMEYCPCCGQRLDL